DDAAWPAMAQADSRATFAVRTKVARLSACAIAGHAASSSQRAAVVRQYAHAAGSGWIFARHHRCSLGLASAIAVPVQRIPGSCADVSGGTERGAHSLAAIAIAVVFRRAILRLGRSHAC